MPHPTVTDSDFTDAVAKAKFSLEAVPSELPQEPDAKVIDAIVSATEDCRIAVGLVRELRAWTEGDLRALDRETQDSIPSLEARCRELLSYQCAQRSRVTSSILDAWYGFTGIAAEGGLPERMPASETNRAAAFFCGLTLVRSLRALAKVIDQCVTAGVDVVPEPVNSKLPRSVIDQRALANQIERVSRRIEDDAGKKFADHHDRWLNEEDYDLPQSMRLAVTGSIDDPWIDADAFDTLTSSRLHDPASANAYSYWRMSVFGLERTRWFFDDNPDHPLRRAWSAHAAEYEDLVDSIPFWSAVSREFFQPEAWELHARDLRPVIALTSKLRRLRLDREVKELHQSYITGNYVSAIALCRVVAERLIADRLGDDRNVLQTVDFEVLINRFADSLQIDQPERAALHRLRVQANRYLHRSRLEEKDLDDRALQPRALESIQALYSLIERLGKSSSG